jgi:hypothetical protein
MKSCRDRHLLNKRDIVLNIIDIQDLCRSPPSISSARLDDSIIDKPLSASAIAPI